MAVVRMQAVFLCVANQCLCSRYIFVSAADIISFAEECHIKVASVLLSETLPNQRHIHRFPIVGREIPHYI